MENKNDTNSRWIIAGLVLIFCISCYFLWHATRTDTQAGNDVDRTIQQLEGDNQRAGGEIGTAARQAGEAQSNISRAVERADRAEELTRESQSAVAECEQLAKDCSDLNGEAKSILADVEFANQKRTSGKTTGTAAK